MARRIGGGWAIGAAVLALAWTASAAAEVSDEARAEARQLGQRAMDAFAAEDYPTALALLQRSYELNPVSVTLYNLGMAQRALFDFPAAIDSLKEYLRTASTVAADQRTQIEQFLREMEAALVWVTISVSEPGATVLVDGEAAGVSPLADAVRLRAGSHVIQARKDGFEEARETIQTAAGEQRQVSLALAPVAAAPTLLSVVTEPFGATVFVDGRERGVAPLEIESTPGAHTVRVTLEGHAEATVAAQVVAGRRSELRVELLPLGEPPGGEDEESLAEAWWLWTIVGVVVAGGAVTAGVLLAPGDERPGADLTVDMR